MRAQIDPTVVFFITLGFYGLGRHLLLGPHWRWFWAGCFAAGLGVITKGVGFLALLALLPYAWMRWRDWKGLSAPAPRGAGRWALGAVGEPPVARLPHLFCTQHDRKSKRLTSRH